MSIEQLTSIEEQFTRHLQTIRTLSKNLPKSQTLRIGAWLKKLCSVVDNYFWRKNRNLYTEVLALMLQQDSLGAPFDKSPPDGSLPKLTLYEIPFSIRQKLESAKTRHDDKQNNLELSNLNVARIGSLQANNLRCKKRHSLALKSFKSMNEKQNQYLFEENDDEAKQTQRKDRSLCNGHADERNQRLMVRIEQVLHFLAKHNRKFQQDREYYEFMEEIVEFGDEAGRNFRQLKFSVINQ